MYGFKYHHAEGDNAKLVLWLLDTPSKVPIFASHHCGVAGLVIHDNKILVVKEKSKIVGWKLPGGYLNLGEDFDEAAMREVKEETGILTEYQDLIAFRHSHNVQFGRGDMYFICRLRALSHDIVVEDEIDDAKWMDINEFKLQTKHELLSQVIHLIECNAVGLEEKVMKSVLSSRPPFKFYFTPQYDK
jgi:ADP-ribose pyrophosphatase YjhB (NUDIX family)